MATTIASLQLATNHESRHSGNLGLFYESTVFDYTISSEATSLVIAGQNDGTVDTSVDDKISITMYNHKTGDSIASFTFDYSHNNQGYITPVSPINLLDSSTWPSGATSTGDFAQAVGVAVNITTQFTDLFQNYRGGSNIWLVMQD